MSAPVTLEHGNLATAVKLVRDKIAEAHQQGRVTDEELPVIYAVVDMVATFVRKAGNIDDQLTRIANTLEHIEMSIRKN